MIITFTDKVTYYTSTRSKKCDEVVADRRTFGVVDCFSILGSGRLEKQRYSSSRGGCAVAAVGTGRSGSKSLARELGRRK